MAIPTYILDEKEVPNLEGSGSMETVLPLDLMEELEGLSVGRPVLRRPTHVIEDDEVLELSVGGGSIRTVLPPGLEEELSAWRDRIAARRPSDKPENYDDWLVDLKNPEQFLTNMEDVEETVRALKRVKRKLLEVDNNLDRALLRLRLPFLNEGEEDLILKSAEWPEIRELLLLFESRFIPRIPGIVYLLKRANDYLYRGKPFVGIEDCEGFVDIIDARGFTKRTILEGARASSESLSSGLYGPTFDALERSDGELLAGTAADALVTVRDTDSIEETRESHLRFLANAAQKLRVPCHITSGSGPFILAITPGGKLLVLGRAFELADRAQDISRTELGDCFNSKIILINEDGEAETLEVSELSGEMPLPEHSAIHFFKGMDVTNFREDFAKTPARLLEGIRQQMALMAAPMSREALQSKETVERSAISLYIQSSAQETEGQKGYAETVRWERQLGVLAKKYNAKVKFINVSGGKKSGILIFGAQGSSQVNKEERSARCANELLAFDPHVRIGIKQGAIHISNMGEMDISGVQEVISDAVNGSQRLATLRLEDGLVGRIRIDEATYELFKQRGVLIADGIETEVDLRSYGLQRVCLGEGFDVQKTSAYVRDDKVEEVVFLVKYAQTGSSRQFNLAGGFGEGQDAVLMAAVQRLQAECGMQLVLLPEYHDRRSYSGIREVLKAVFSGSKEFEDWMDKTRVPAGQREFWKMLFAELNGSQEELFLLANPDYARPELVSMLKALGDNFGVACPRWDQMDRISREILSDSKIALLAVGSETADEKIDFGKISLEEVRRVVAFHLQVGIEDLVDSPIVSALSTLASQNGEFSLSVVEILLRNWLNQGVVQLGSATFKDQEVDVSRRVPQLENMVTHYFDQLRSASARTLFCIALALGHFSYDQLLMAADPPVRNFEDSVLELRNVGIFRRDGVAFVEPFFVPAGRQVQELRVERKHALQVRNNMGIKLDENQISMSQYLEACGQMGVIGTGQVRRRVLEKMEEALRAERLLEVMDIGQQFMNWELEIEQLKESDFRQVLSIYQMLIEAKIVLGENVEGDLARVFVFVESIPEEFRANLFDSIGRIFDLRAEAFHKANRDLEAHQKAVSDLEEHFKTGTQPQKPFLTAGMIILHKAKLAYRRADSDGLREERLAFVDEALSGLRTVLPLGIEPFDSDVRRLFLQAEGYRLLDLGESQSQESLRAYILEVQKFLKKQTGAVGQQQEANLQLRLFVARAYMAPQNEPIDIETGEQEARQIIREAAEHHFRDAGLKGYNYLINVPEIKGGGLLATGRYQEAYAEFGHMEQMLVEMKVLAAPLRDQESVAGTLLASELTWAFALIEQYNCLEKLGQSTAMILHKLKREWEEILIYQKEHPRAWLKYTPYISHLRGFVETH